jgi:hypothetical protein
LVVNLAIFFPAVAESHFYISYLQAHDHLLSDKFLARTSDTLSKTQSQTLQGQNTNDGFQSAG